VIAADSDT
jgi:acetolactate synthase-1/2/3 large subunit